MYRTENDFKKALVNALKKRGWITQLLEVGAINRGVPDLMACRGGEVIFIECKNMPKTEGTDLVIDFRAGQQAWHVKWARKGAKVYTAVALKITYKMFRVDEIHYDNHFLLPDTHKSIDSMLDKVRL